MPKLDWEDRDDGSGGSEGWAGEDPNDHSADRDPEPEPEPESTEN